jgi:O-methyltransferase
MQFPDRQFYKQDFKPWLGYGEFGEYSHLVRDSLVSNVKLYYLYSFFMQTIPVLGDIAECGVYKGGTAIMLSNLMCDKCANKRLHLFDTFKGMPNCNPELDSHHIGDFSDTSLDAVKKAVAHDDIVIYHVGFIPDTFKGLENGVFSFVHLDVDIYQSYVDCLCFFWPRLSVGGVMVFDDYGHPNCTGARKAVNEFFADKREKPISLHEGQAVLIKGFS